MEFDKSRCYSALNADELKAGDKVIVAQHLGNLKHQVSQKDYYVWTIKEIKEDICSDRFVTGNGAFPLAYLIERKENCTNCGEGKWDAEHPELTKCCNYKRYECSEYKPITEQKAEKHYRPFKDTDELIEKWWELDGWSKREVQYKKDKLRMPLIWVQRKGMNTQELITGFDKECEEQVQINSVWRNMQDLFKLYEFLDGSLCGVEE